MLSAEKWEVKPAPWPPPPFFVPRSPYVIRIERIQALLFVPGSPHVVHIERRQAPFFRARITTCCCSLSQVKGAVHVLAEGPMSSRMGKDMSLLRALVLAARASSPLPHSPRALPDSCRLPISAQLCGSCVGISIYCFRGLTITKCNRSVRIERQIHWSKRPEPWLPRHVQRGSLRLCPAFFPCPWPSQACAQHGNADTKPAMQACLAPSPRTRILGRRARLFPTPFPISPPAPRMVSLTPRS